MRISKKQVGSPRGLLGSLAGRFISRSNRGLNAWITSSLAIEHNHCLLEIGFGQGALIDHVVKHTSVGYVVGIDSADDMVQQASQLNRDAIEDGRVLLEIGNVSELTFETMTFDRIVSVNTFHLWPDPAANLQEVRRTMRPGGRLILAMHPDGHKQRAQVPMWRDRIGKALQVAEFRDVQTKIKEIKRVPTLLVSGAR